MNSHTSKNIWTEQTRIDGWRTYYCYFHKLIQFLTIVLYFLCTNKYRSQFLPKKLPDATDENCWRDPQVFKIQRLSDLWVPNLNGYIYNPISTPKAQSNSWKRKQNDCKNQDTCCQIACSRHNRKFASMKSQQYGCLNKTGIMMTLLTFQHGWVLFHKVSLLKEELQESMTNKIGRILFLHRQALW